MTKFKNIAIIVLSAGIILLFSLTSILSPAKPYSLTERRTLAQLPQLTLSSLVSGKYMSDFEDCVLDQFPLRDDFRTLKANTLRYVFRQKDNHGLYLEDGYLSKLEYPANEAKWKIASDKLNEVYDEFLSDTDCKIYLSVIPDKNCFLAPKGGYPVMDSESLVSSLREDLRFASYIDIFDTLSLDSFYKTDQHWRQEKISPTAHALAAGMDADITAEYTELVLSVPFYGAYVGQSALNVKPDTIHYLINETLSACTVTSYDKGAPAPAHMYDMEKAQGRDPYEMFVSGSDALITIENPNAAENRELVIFRDSFASSITPLLVPAYSKITLVDLRYMRSDMIGNFVDFEDQDVLFLYSTLILNNTISM